MLVLFPGGAQTEQTGSFDAGRHICQLELDSLVLHDLLSKSLSFPGIPERQLIGAGSDSQGLGGNPDTAPRQYPHGECETEAIGADPVFLRHANIAKGNAMGVAAADA